MYSSSNSLIANSQELYFKRPELKNTMPTPIRMPSWMIDSGKQWSHARAVNKELAQCRAVLCSKQSLHCRSFPRCSIAVATHRPAIELKQGAADLERRIGFERAFGGACRC